MPTNHVEYFHMRICNELSFFEVSVQIFCWYLNTWFMCSHYWIFRVLFSLSYSLGQLHLCFPHFPASASSWVQDTWNFPSPPPNFTHSTQKNRKGQGQLSNHDQQPVWEPWLSLKEFSQAASKTLLMSLGPSLNFARPITWAHVRNTDSWAPLQTYNLNQILHFNGIFQVVWNVHEGWRILSSLSDFSNHDGASTIWQVWRWALIRHQTDRACSQEVNLEWPLTSSSDSINNRWVDYYHEFYHKERAYLGIRELKGR